MIRLADWCYRRRWLVLGAWVVLLIVIMTLAGKYPAEYRADYQTPGAEATKAFDLLDERFPARKGDTINIVFFSKAGAITPAMKTVIGDLLARVEKFPHVASVVSPLTPEGEKQVDQSGQTVFAMVHFDRTIDKLANLDADYQKKFLELVQPGVRDALQVEVSQFVASRKLGAETIALGFSAVVLLIAFGSVLAMGLPIVTALIGLGVGAGLGGFLSRVFEAPDWAATVATMIGLGIGVDYALFIVTRYRTGLAKGFPPLEAVVTAMATAGRAVLFAGVTVILSLLGMLMMRLGYMDGMLYLAGIAVVVMLAATLTLLPALLGFIGTRIDRFRVPFAGRERNALARGFWYRWSRVMQRRPWITLGAALLVLLFLTWPITSLRFGFPDDGNNPETETSRRAYDITTKNFGPGFNGPLLIVADLRDALADAQIKLFEAFTALQMHEDIALILPPIFNPAGDTAIVCVYPASKPQSRETVELVNELRHTIIPEAVADTGAKILVGGFTAISIDHAGYIMGRLPLFIAAVLLLSFLLLMVMFRSPLLAFNAGIMNLLSIGPAYGIMAFAANGTWLGQLLNIQETPVPAFVPMIMFAILFGLSMDYEVFLLSSIREEYLKTGDNSIAVADGMAFTARVITAAAAIMVFVFGVFIFDPNVFIKQIGLGLASAILVDTTIIRMVVVPSSMELLGKANWWMPRWLHRILPEIKGETAIKADLAARLHKDSART